MWITVPPKGIFGKSGIPDPAAGYVCEANQMPLFLDAPISPVYTPLVQGFVPCDSHCKRRV